MGDVAERLKERFGGFGATLGSEAELEEIWGAGCSGFRLIQVPKIEAEWLWLEQWVLWVIPWFHLTSRAEIPEAWKLRRCFPVLEDATFLESLTGKV